MPAEHPNADERGRGGIALEAVLSADARRLDEAAPLKGDGRPRLRVRTIERTALVRFEDAEILFEEEAIRAVGDQLHRLIAEGGHTRLVLNFGGVRYVSSDLLGILVGLRRKLDPAGGRIRFCGLDPLLRDMVRMAHLDRMFDISEDEAEALGLMIVR
jgi:anti-anti-sigma factor